MINNADKFFFFLNKLEIKKPRAVYYFEMNTKKCTFSFSLPASVSRTFFKMMLLTWKNFVQILLHFFLHHCKKNLFCLKIIFNLKIMRIVNFFPFKKVFWPNRFLKEMKCWIISAHSAYFFFTNYKKKSWYLSIHKSLINYVTIILLLN